MVEWHISRWIRREPVDAYTATEHDRWVWFCDLCGRQGDHGEEIFRVADLWRRTEDHEVERKPRAIFCVDHNLPEAPEPKVKSCGWCGREIVVDAFRSVHPFPERSDFETEMCLECASKYE